MLLIRVETPRFYALRAPVPVFRSGTGAFLCMYESHFAQSKDVDQRNGKERCQGMLGMVSSGDGAGILSSSSTS